MRISDWSSDVCSSDLDHRAPSYDEPGGIYDLLMALTAYGWKPVEEGGKVIALSGEDGTVSLEPAGQLELSGAPLDNLHQTCAETGRHLKQVREVGEKLGLGFLRSEERSVGKGCVSTSRSGWAPEN